MGNPNEDSTIPLATNSAPMACSVCSQELPAGLGVVLRSCQHPFCFTCLKGAMFGVESSYLECPYPFKRFECKAKLLDDEVDYILKYDEVYDFGQFREEMANGGVLKADESGSADVGLDVPAADVLGVFVERLYELAGLEDIGGLFTEPSSEVEGTLTEPKAVDGACSGTSTVEGTVDDTKVVECVQDSVASSDPGAHAPEIAKTDDFSMKLEDQVSTINGGSSTEVVEETRQMNKSNKSKGANRKVAKKDSGFDVFGLVRLFEVDDRSAEAENEVTSQVEGTIPKDSITTTAEESIEKILKEDTVKLGNASQESQNQSKNPRNYTEECSTELLEAFRSTFQGKGAIPKIPRTHPVEKDLEAMNRVMFDHFQKTFTPVQENQVATSTTQVSTVNTALQMNGTATSTALPNVPKPTIPEVQVDPPKQVSAPRKELSTEDFDFLLALSETSLPPNLEPFECPICNESFQAYEQVMLTQCFHKYCKECLAQTVMHAEDVEVQCPTFLDATTKCGAILLECEIHALLSQEEYMKYQRKCIQKAEAVIINSVHCLKPNCPGWIEMDGAVEQFDCPVCSSDNCTLCKAIHPNLTCDDYKATTRRKEDELLSERTLQTMENTREGMRCPRCGIMITKIAGCDFMTCTKCQTGICWPTRGARWGPGGVGDISGGCRCKVDNGRRCHPECEGCH